MFKTLVFLLLLTGWMGNAYAVVAPFPSTHPVDHPSAGQAPADHGIPIPSVLARQGVSGEGMVYRDGIVSVTFRVEKLVFFTGLGFFLAVIWSLSAYPVLSMAVLGIAALLGWLLIALVNRQF